MFIQPDFTSACSAGRTWDPPPAFPDHGLCYLQPALRTGVRLPGKQKAQGQQDPHSCFSKSQGLWSWSYTTSTPEPIFLHVVAKLGWRLPGSARCSCIPRAGTPAEAGTWQPRGSAQDTPAPLQPLRGAQNTS